VNITFDDTLNAIKGRNYSGKIPYSFWKHFPKKDLNVSDLVKSHLDFQNQIESDLIKFSPNSKYCLLDFGLEMSKEYNQETGSYLTQKYPINSITDWEKIDEIDPLDGHLGLQLSALKKISSKVEDKPIMMTIFLPMMVADKLVSSNDLVSHLEEDPVLVKDRIRVIEKVMTHFAIASLESGAAGLFLATQHTQEKKGWTAQDWVKYIYPVDNTLIKEVKNKSLFTVLHFHGSNIFFKEVLSKITVTAINWHHFDKLPDGIQTSKENILGLVGGLEENKLVDIKSEEEVKNLINATIEIFKEHLPQLILAPGCVLPQKVSLDTLKLVIKKLKERKIVLN
jgi:uroporphyrinogen decarboxylase